MFNLGIVSVDWIPWEPVGWWHVAFDNGAVLFFGFKGSLLGAEEAAP